MTMGIKDLTKMMREGNYYYDRSIPVVERQVIVAERKVAMAKKQIEIA